MDEYERHALKEIASNTATNCVVDYWGNIWLGLNAFLLVMILWRVW